MASGNEVMKKQIENEWRQKIENAKHRRSHFCRKIPPYFTGHRTNLDFSEKSCEVSSVPQFTGIISKLCHALLDHQRYKKETDLGSVWHHYGRNFLILSKKCLLSFQINKLMIQCHNKSFFWLEMVNFISQKTVLCTIFS